MPRIAEHLADSLQHAFTRNGGILTRTQLCDAGASDRAITSLIGNSQIIRARTNRYVPADTLDALLRAARLGGRATASTLFAALGAWQPADDNTIHIAIPYHFDSPPRPHKGFRVHRSHEPGVLLYEPLDSAIAHLVRATSRANALAVLDSVIERNIASMDVVSSALTRHGTDAALQILRLLDPGAGSGVESMFRDLLHSLRISYRTQVPIGRYRVDFLLGTRLVVEIVGEQYHGGTEAFEYDAARELFLQTMGYQVVRITARQVMAHLSDVREAILAMVRRGQHVYGPTPELRV